MREAPHEHVASRSPAGLRPGRPVAGSGPLASHRGPPPVRAAGLLAGGGPQSQCVSPVPLVPRRSLFSAAEATKATDASDRPLT
jgi:hypothetical protein